MIKNTSQCLTHPIYRSDIDGLRAIAVLFVVVFHAFPNCIEGGFIGVDIFFVISGFLISTIIYGSLKRNSFSFVDFYIRRIKRIFPALLLVMSVSLICGWFVLLADEYKYLGKHIAAGASFISNFVLWNESGYFDSASEAKPLLHLWSLGVEEQFYIVWPVLLWLSWKRDINLLALTVIVAAVSFALNVGLTHSDKVAAFYSPFTRFWELLSGSTLAYFTMYKQNLSTKFALFAKLNFEAKDAIKSYQSIIGAALIIASAFLLTKENYFPGWWAMLPTVGAVLIISSGSEAWLNRVVLSHWLLVWLGLISFPLYLWHWPLLSFAHIFEAGTPSFKIKLVIVLLSIVLAWLTYRLFELPIRFGQYSKAKAVILLALMILVACIGYIFYKEDGLRFRLKDRQEYADFFENSPPTWGFFNKTDMLKKQRYECNFFDLEKYREGNSTPIPRDQIDKSCFQRSRANDSAVFIWGDSHAQHLYPGLKNNLPANWQILQVASSGCAPNVNVTEPSATSYCDQSNWFAMKSINETKPDVVIVAQNLGHDIENFHEIAAKLKTMGIKKVIFMGPTPHWTTDLPRVIVKKLWSDTPRRTYEYVDQKILHDNASLKERFNQTESESYVDLIELFCNTDGCLTYIGNDKKLGITSWDYGHLTPMASDYLAKNILVKLIDGN